MIAILIIIIISVRCDASSSSEKEKLEPYQPAKIYESDKRNPDFYIMKYNYITNQNRKYGEKNYVATNEEIERMKLLVEL